MGTSFHDTQWAREGLHGAGIRGAGGRSWRDGEKGFVSPPSSEAVSSQAVGDLSFPAHSVSTY